MLYTFVKYIDFSLITLIAYMITQLYESRVGLLDNLF